MAKKRKRGIGAIAGGAEIIKDSAALIVGGLGGTYVNKFGAMSPILPSYAGPIANVVIGVALKKMVKNDLIANVGNGMIVVAGLYLLNGFGINGGEFVNGDDAMIAAYKARKAVNGNQPIINGSIVNGLISDNAVQSDNDLF